MPVDTATSRVRRLLPGTKKPTVTTEPLAFQDLILTLHKYWGDQGCAILQPYDIEVGAGTLHPATVLRALGPRPWKAAYVQPSRRPGDGRYGENPNRLQHYYQYQVILKPNPDDLQALYLGSLAAIGIDPKLHDIRFVEDDWENPTVGFSQSSSTKRISCSFGSMPMRARLSRYRSCRSSGFGFRIT